MIISILCNVLLYTIICHFALIFELYERTCVCMCMIIPHVDITLNLIMIERHFNILFKYDNEIKGTRRERGQKIP